MDSLRGGAALIVLFWHLDRFSGVFGLPGLGYGKTTAADAAVVLFFVLSGFLITLLLLRERQASKRIYLRQFYQRRALRILPVYGVALVWALILSWLRLTPAKGSQFLYYLLGVPNYAYAFGFAIFCLKPLWSIGVEEQFYLCWPWLVSRTKRLPRILLGICLIYLALKTGLRFLENRHWYELVRLTSIDSLAIGAYAAWLLHTRSPYLKYVLCRPSQVFCWGFVVYGLLVRPLQITSLLSAETQAPVFACIVLNMAASTEVAVKAGRGPLNRLGSISYGLYAYHMLVMYSIAPAIKKLTTGEGPEVAFCVAAVATFALSILVATLSWRLLERPLLERKPYPTPRSSSLESVEEAQTERTPGQ